MNITLVMWGGLIVIAGFLIGLIIILSTKKRRNKRIQHYERIRDELTLRKKKPKQIKKAVKQVEEEYSGSSIGSILANLICAFIILMVGINLIPEISNQIELSLDETNVTSSGYHMISMVSDMMPLYFTMIIIVIIIGAFAPLLRSTGLLGQREESLKQEIKTGIEHYEDIRDDLTRRD